MDLHRLGALIAKKSSDIQHTDHQSEIKPRRHISQNSFFRKYFENVYYKNINVSTTNHFTLVDKAIYICTSHTLQHTRAHTGLMKEERTGGGGGRKTVLLF